MTYYFEKNKTQMKIKPLLLFSFFLLNQTSFSQAPSLNRQVSFNAASLLSFLDFPGSIYQLSLRKLGSTSNQRIALGGNLNVDASGNGVLTTSQINFAIGREKFKDFGKKEQWRAFYGAEFISLLQVVNIQGGRLALGGGVSPFFGIQYSFNDRLSLGIETAYNFMVSFSVIDGDVSGRINLTYVPPGALWLGYRFNKIKKNKE